MSDVISFRMDKGNPRESQTLEVLKKGQEAGYSLRHILTEALLALEAVAEDEQAVERALTEVTRQLTDIQSILEGLEHQDVSPVQKSQDLPDQSTLIESFLQSVKSAARPGMSLTSG